MFLSRLARFTAFSTLRFTTLCALLFAVPVAWLAIAAAQQPNAQTQMVAMSDGVQLATDVYLPKGDGPFPTILMRTPYNKDGNKAIAGNVTALGYALVAQDMRGRFASEGHPAIIFGNDGLGNEHHDGHETIKWVAEQSWSNGRIGTYGASALGIVQNMTAPNAPAALQGQVVSVAFSDYYSQGAYQGGVWRKELLEGWLTATGMTDINLPTFLEHNTCDDFWKELSAERHAEQVNAPGLFVGGWYDIFVQGTINSFTTIQEEGGPNAKGKCFLVIAPTAHGAFSAPIVYPEAANAPINMVAPMNLYAHWLKEPQTDVEKLQPVHYYVMGDTTDPNSPGNEWRSADSWPPPSTPTRFFLHADHSLSGERPTGDDSLTYKFDPNDPVPTIGGQNLMITKGPMDQRDVESRDDVLVFTSEPLSEPLEITGRITATLAISSDCPDTDFTVKLCDVHPDGRSLLVTDGIRRASLRNGFEQRELLEPGEVYEVEVDLWSTSLIFNKGHRIRVSVSSSNAPRFEPNPNNGDVHYVKENSRVATNTVYLSAEHPSRIVLPVCANSDTR